MCTGEQQQRCSLLPSGRRSAKLGCSAPGSESGHAAALPAVVLSAVCVCTPAVAQRQGRCMAKMSGLAVMT